MAFFIIVFLSALIKTTFKKVTYLKTENYTSSKQMSVDPPAPLIYYRSFPHYLRFNHTCTHKYCSLKFTFRQLL